MRKTRERLVPLPVQGFIVMAALVVLWFILMYLSPDVCTGWAITAGGLYLLYWSSGGQDGTQTISPGTEQVAPPAPWSASASAGGSCGGT